MNIGIIGVGGVGGYFGGKLTQLSPDKNKTVNVYFLARGAHLDAIRNQGLLVKTSQEGEFLAKPTLATDTCEDLPELDLCLICVKSYDLDRVLQSLKKKATAKTHVIPLLNGIDIYQRVKTVLTPAMVHPACVYVGTHIEAPGVVAQNGGACMIIFGQDPEREQAQTRDVTDLFDSAGIKYRFLENADAEIWAKYIFIAAYGMVGAGENKSLGQILDSAESSRRVKGIMQEIAALAAKQGVGLKPEIVEEAFGKARNFPYETTTSYHRDFENKEKPNESEIFGDTIIRLGKEMGINTPVTLEVKALLRQR